MILVKVIRTDFNSGTCKGNKWAIVIAVLAEVVRSDCSGNTYRGG